MTTSPRKTTIYIFLECLFYNDTHSSYILTKKINTNMFLCYAIKIAFLLVKEVLSTVCGFVLAGITPRCVRIGRDYEIPDVILAIVAPLDVLAFKKQPLHIQ